MKLRSAGFRRSLIAGAMVLGLGLRESASAQEPLPPLDSQATLFRDVHIVTMTEGGTLRNHSVLVRDGRIAQVASREQLQAPEEVRIIEGGGNAWLIPGLCDMHVHFPPLPGDHGDAGWRAAALLLANGITTARGMVGHPAQLKMRERIISGELQGPTVHLAGKPLMVQEIKSPEQAAAAVKQQAEAGFDFIKSHRLVAPDVYLAVHAAAKEAGIPVTGHVDNEVGLERAIPTGQQQEHLDGWLAAMLTDPTLADNFGQLPASGLPDKLDTSRMGDLAEQIASAEIWTTPTLALFRQIADTTTPLEEIIARPGMKYIMPQAVNLWMKQRQGMSLQGPFADRTLAQWFISTRNEIVQALHRAGAPLLAGSDSPQAFLVTGFALHDELQALVDAGLKPLDALAAATCNPARYMAGLVNSGSALGIEPDFGQIADGRRADLVLLTADPAAEIAATRRIQGVMIRGRWLDRSALDALLGEVETSVKPAG